MDSFPWERESCSSGSFISLTEQENCSNVAVNIHQAAVANDPATLSALLTNASLIDLEFETYVDRSLYKVPALAVAASKGYYEVVMMLIMEGKVNVDQKCSQNGYTALMWAAQCGHVAIIQFLLQSEANVNARDDFDGCSALGLAASGGHAAAVEVLLQAGANVHETENYGWTALIWASQRGQVATMNVLLCAGADVHVADKVGKTALMLAAEQGHVSAVELLLQAGADVNTHDKDGNSALIIAARSTTAVAVSALLQGPSTPTEADKLSALLIVCCNGMQAAVKALLQAHVDVNAKDINGATPLIYACMNGHAHIITLLLQAGANVHTQDKMHKSALMWAATEGYIAALKVLIQAGSHVNIQNTHGVTALMFAAQKGYITAIVELLRAGADVNIQDSDGCTALMIAAQYAQKSSVEVILQRSRIDIHIQDNRGRSCLEIRCSNEVQWLLEDFIITLPQYIHDAAVIGDKNRLVRLLVSARSVDLEYRSEVDHRPLTVLIAAAYKSHNEIVKLLLKTEKIDMNKQLHECAAVLGILHKERVEILLQSIALELRCDELLLFCTIQQQLYNAEQEYTLAISHTITGLYLEKLSLKVQTLQQKYASYLSLTESEAHKLSDEIRILLLNIPPLCASLQSICQYTQVDILHRLRNKLSDYIVELCERFPYLVPSDHAGEVLDLAGFGFDVQREVVAEDQQDTLSELSAEEDMSTLVSELHPPTLYSADTLQLP